METIKRKSLAKLQKQVDEFNNKTKEEILKASYYWHAASDGVYYREDAVYEAMESYSQQSNRQKEDRIAELEKCLSDLLLGLKREMSDGVPVKRSAYVAAQMSKAKNLLSKPTI